METHISKHVGVYGVIINDNSEVLLIGKGRGAYKGKLDLPGGGIEKGETVEETLVRELNEETGLIVKNFKLRTVITHYEVWQMEEGLQEDLSHYAIIYDVELPDEINVKENADGHDSLGASWYKIDQLDINELSPLAKCIKDLK